MNETYVKLLNGDLLLVEHTDHADLYEKVATELERPLEEVTMTHVENGMMFVCINPNSQWDVTVVPYYDPVLVRGTNTFHYVGTFSIILKKGDIEKRLKVVAQCRQQYDGLEEYRYTYHDNFMYHVRNMYGMAVEYYTVDPDAAWYSSITKELAYNFPEYMLEEVNQRLLLRMILYQELE